MTLATQTRSKIRMHPQLPGAGQLIFAPPPDCTYPNTCRGNIIYLCSTADCGGVFTAGACDHPVEIAHVTFRCPYCHAHSVICLGACAEAPHAAA